MKSRAQLKQEVKQLFKGRWKSAILLCLVISLVSILGITSQAVDQYQKTATSGGGSASSSFDPSLLVTFGIMAIVMAVVELVIYLVVKLFRVGTSYSMLDWVRQPQREIHPVADSTIGFTKPYGWHVAGLAILQAIWIGLWTLLLIVPGIIKAYAYSQSYYIYKDMVAATPAGQPAPRVRDAVTRSRQLMRGHKFEYFVLQLSFIGWGLLSGLTFGIGQLWLTPYYIGTMSNYYDNLVANSATN